MQSASGYEIAPRARIGLGGRNDSSFVGATAPGRPIPKRRKSGRPRRSPLQDALRTKYPFPAQRPEDCSPGLMPAFL